MDTDRVGRVRSYVYAQLPFVPLYGTDLLGPAEPLPEVLSLQTPVLTARNPLATIQPELHTSTASVCLGIQTSGSIRPHADPTLTTEIQRSRSAGHPLGAEERTRRPRLKKRTRTAPDPDSFSEPAKEHTIKKREGKLHREKPRLPTSLSVLYGFAPKNVGPSRLTVPASDRGVFRKGKSSSTKAGVSFPDLTRSGPKTTAMGPYLSSSPLSGGLDINELAHPRKHQKTHKFTGIAEDARSQPEKTEGTLDSHSATWDIELEDGILPSDTSSITWGTTVVIDTERIWSHEKETQPLQTIVDPRDRQRFLTSRSPGKHPPSSPRVASRFFSKCVSGLHESRSFPHVPTPGWEDHPDMGPTWDDFVHHHCTDAVGSQFVSRD